MLCWPQLQEQLATLNVFYTSISSEGFLAINANREEENSTPKTMPPGQQRAWNKSGTPTRTRKTLDWWPRSKITLQASRKTTCNAWLVVPPPRHGHFTHWSVQSRDKNDELSVTLEKNDACPAFSRRVTLSLVIWGWDKLLVSSSQLFFFFFWCTSVPLAAFFFRSLSFAFHFRRSIHPLEEFCLPQPTFLQSTSAPRLKSNLRPLL